MTQTMQYDIPGTLVFWRQRPRGRRGHPQWAAK